MRLLTGAVRHKGVLYNTRLDITVPDREIVIKREPHEDLYVSIGDAFRAAQRQIEDYDRERRRKVKYHEEMPRAIVSALFPEKGYGFLTTPVESFIFIKTAYCMISSKILRLE
ncbi:MAG: hypothetical protein LWX02_04095 [Deltaproteobacteria bacterium]|nr:hypothetical protein [Deltaproteobacteria bacterium]